MLRDFLPLPDVLVQVVKEYARPFVVGLIEDSPGYFEAKEAVTFMPLLDGVVLVQNFLRNDSRKHVWKALCEEKNIPFVDTMYGLNKGLYAVMETVFSKPDFVLLCSTYVDDLGSLIVDKTLWSEECITLECQKRYQIRHQSPSNYQTLTLFPGYSFQQYRQDDQCRHSPLVPHELEKLKSVAFQSRFEGIRKGFDDIISKLEIISKQVDGI